MKKLALLCVCIALATLPSVAFAYPSDGGGGCAGYWTWDHRWVCWPYQPQAVRGFAQDIEPAYGESLGYERPVIALIAAQNFPDLDFLAQATSEGAQKRPSAIWVVPRGNGAQATIRQTLESLDVEYLLAVKVERYELASCCSQVVVFHDGKSARTQWFVDRAKQPYGRNIWVCTREAKRRPRKTAAKATRSLSAAS